MSEVWDSTIRSAATVTAAGGRDVSESEDEDECVHPATMRRTIGSIEADLASSGTEARVVYCVECGAEWEEPKP